MTQSIAFITDALGWTLLHAVWQGTVIGLLFVLSRSVLGSASPSIRHANALAWLLLFVLIPVFTFVGLLLARPGAGVVSVVPSMLSTMQITRWPVEFSRLQAGTLPVVGCLWLSGVLVLTARQFAAWRQLERFTVLGGRPLPQLELPFAELRDAMKVRITVGLMEAANATVPMVIGFLKPVIVLPSSALLGLAPRELQLIIAHELAHLRRKDHLTNYLLVAAETLLFFHPVLYMLTRTIRHERELCCDDMVITTFNERVCYAHALSKLEAMRSMHVLRANSLRLAASDGPLVTRIARMVRRRTHNRWGVMPAAVLPFVAASFALGVFHQAHPGSGHGGLEKSFKSIHRYSDNALQPERLVPADSVEDTQLQLVQIPYYPRRSVSAATVSRITLALTRTDRPQSLSAIERGGKLSALPAIPTDDTVPFVAGQKPTDKPFRRVLASIPDLAVSQSQSSGFTNVRHVPILTDVTDAPADRDAGSTRVAEEPGTTSNGTWPTLSPEPINTESARGLNAAYRPAEATALFAPVTGQAGLPALPLYRPEPSTTSAALPGGKITAESVSGSDPVESGGALIHRVTPRYPLRARSRGLVDKVVVSIEVDASGNVSGVSVINHHARPMFRRSVVRAVSQWQFEPLLRNGVPVERTVEQSFDFRLEPMTAKRSTQKCGHDRSSTRADMCRVTG